MKVEDLIKQLEAFPKDMEVCIFDWRKNLHHADAEFQGNGIVATYRISLMKEDVNTPFVALLFENSDYNKDGTPDMASSICESIMNTIVA